jgi:hypothetical protein
MTTRCGVFGLNGKNAPHSAQYRLPSSGALIAFPALEKCIRIEEHLT